MRTTTSIVFYRDRGFQGFMEGVGRVLYFMEGFLEGFVVNGGVFRRVLYFRGGVWRVL